MTTDEAERYIKIIWGNPRVARECTLCEHFETTRAGRGWEKREGKAAQARMIQHIKREHQDLKQAES